MKQPTKMPCLLATCVAFALLLAPTAAASGPLASIGELGQSRLLENGLLEVKLRTGGTLLTHGADGPETSAPLAPTAERAPLCSSSAHQRVLYGHHISAPNRLEEARPVIRAAIWGMNAELDRAALRSGAQHADYRVRCDGSGDLRIDTFVNIRSAAFADVVDAARLATHLDPNVDYTIFYDDPTPDACGFGSFVPDSRPGPDNSNNSGGGYAVVYSDCWDAATAMHESAHNQGAVQPDAPNGTGERAHCRDEADVMCYPDGSAGGAAMMLLCEGAERFDCNDDDYFDASPEHGEYLATHWNLGSAANRFVELSPVGPEERIPGVGACDPACPEEPVTDEPVVEPLVRIAVRRLRIRSGRVDVSLSCPMDRYADCTGKLDLRRTTGGPVGSRRFDVIAGSTARVRVTLSATARRDWARGRIRRLSAFAIDEPAEDFAVRDLALPRVARAARRPR